MPNREHELRAAIDRARIPTRDSRIYSRLLGRKAQWVTGEIKDRYQPRSVRELAALCSISEATTLRGLSALEANGWITRERKATPGPRSGTAYQLRIGTDYPALSASQPKTGAERTREWRKRLRQSAVTQGQERRQSDVVDYVSERHTTAGQPPFPAKEGRDEGEVVEDVLKACDRAAADEQILSKLPVYPESWQRWPEGSIGEEVFDRAVGVLRDAGMLPAIGQAAA